MPSFPNLIFGLSSFNGTRGVVVNVIGTSSEQSWIKYKEYWSVLYFFYTYSSEVIGLRFLRILGNSKYVRGNVEAYHGANTSIVYIVFQSFLLTSLKRSIPSLVDIRSIG